MFLTTDVNSVILNYFLTPELWNCVVDKTTAENIKTHLFLKHPKCKMEPWWNVSDVILYVKMFEKGCSVTELRKCPIRVKIILNGVPCSGSNKFLIPNDVHVTGIKSVKFKGLNHYNVLDLMYLSIEFHKSLYNVKKISEESRIASKKLFEVRGPGSIAHRRVYDGTPEEEAESLKKWLKYANISSVSYWKIDKYRKRKLWG